MAVQDYPLTHLPTGSTALLVAQIEHVRLLDLCAGVWSGVGSTDRRAGVSTERNLRPLQGFRRKSG